MLYSGSGQKTRNLLINLSKHRNPSGFRCFFRGETIQKTDSLIVELYEKRHGGRDDIDSTRNSVLFIECEYMEGVLFEKQNTEKTKTEV